ncbi:MAG: CDP-diacylglycerol--glycerol-3-phosphate 3-phosphatidyltransferase [Rickettsiales bacterium TMED254]|nr:MAG: CDP-diacylglycerol--glycerol-3-phosphate 3-phosphatidyltransferase [Rickettsiales bacterium TMED254]
MNLMKMIKLSNIPNYLTLFRIVCIPIIIICLLPQNSFFNWIALILYAFAGLSDFLDGYLARKYNIETNFGKFFDPIADKILVISVIFILVAIDKISGFFIYPSLIIIIREILVSGLREFFSKTKTHINVTNLSKLKTLIQMFSLGFIIIGNDFALINHTSLIGEIGLTFASILTIYTGYIYFKDNLKSF